MDIAWYAGGLATGLVIAWRIHRRLLNRISKHSSLETLTNDLEKRREAYDSDRDTEIPPGAGEPGDQSNLFAVHPGAMHLAHLAEKRSENRAKSLDLGQDSTTLDLSGSQTTSAQDR